MKRSEMELVRVACAKAAQLTLKLKDKIPRKDSLYYKPAIAFDGEVGGMEMVSVELLWADLETITAERLAEIFFLACYKPTNRSLS